AGGAGDENDFVTLTWSAPLMVKPLETATEELDTEDVALRFTVDGSGPVKFRDDAAGLHGSAAWVHYGATSQTLRLAGRGPVGVVLGDARGAKVEAGDIEANLAERTAHITGPGTASQAGDGSDVDGSLRPNIAWADQADFTFTPESEGDDWALREAMFTGLVKADDPASAASLKGDFFRAIFVAGIEQPSVLSRLIVEGQAHGDAGDGGSLRADDLDVAFRRAETAEEESEPDPRILTARGNVRAKQKSATLTCEFLESGLERNAEGDVTATDVTAHAGESAGSWIEFARTDGVRARARELHASVPEQTVELTGEDSLVARGGTEVIGALIKLNGLMRTLQVVGAGRFEHTPKATTEGSLGARGVEATWVTGMYADDVSGVIECVGDVSANTDPEALEVDLVRGQRVRIELEAAATGGDADGSGPGTMVMSFPDDDGEADRADGAPDPPDVMPDRQVKMAEVFASASPDAVGPASVPAIAESRRYVVDTGAGGAEGGRKLERFLRLSGQTITADNTAGTLRVPGNGSAALFDGRESEPGENAEGLASGSSRGASLFRWTGEMSLNRGTGLLKMDKTVSLVHKPLGEEPPTTLESDALEATLRSKSESADGSALGDARGAQLQRAVATGAVYIKSASKQLIGDRVVYDAIARTARASAEPGNRVTLFDEAKGAPISALEIFWLIGEDRIEVTKPMPVTAPR
ncbi:MAG: hypothetical protein H7Y88_04855, partial [Phycisphaerales bacterium]|nr:hypothetical protein [Phycisphaerales bacterium]